MRKIAANYIFPVNRPPIRNGVITVDDQGEIIDIQDNNGDLLETARLEFYNGVLVPGFVNCHAHTELSHLKKKIPPGLGMTGFIKKIRELRGEITNLSSYIKLAHEEMMQKGIVAVADIVNQSEGIDIKKKGGIRYLNFIELFGLDPEKVDSILTSGQSIANQYLKEKLEATLTIHATYSVNDELVRRIIGENNQTPLPLSVHFLESEAEYDLLHHNKGALHDLMEQINGGKPLNIDSLRHEGFIGLLDPSKRLMLVHNNKITEDIIEKIIGLHSNTFWVLCPNSNLFIHDSLPPVNLITKKSENICLGTDSLASNDSLSILDEIITLTHHFPTLSFEKMVKWATLNGATALGLENNYGSLEKGKKPGINLLHPFNFTTMKPAKGTSVKKLC